MPVPLPYYRFKQDSTDAYRCPHPSNCVGLPRNGTGQQLCLKGAIGPLCMICQPGYYLRESTSQCEECDTVTEQVTANLQNGVPRIGVADPTGPLVPRPSQSSKRFTTLKSLTSDSPRPLWCNRTTTLGPRSASASSCWWCWRAGASRTARLRGRRCQRINGF